MGGLEGKQSTVQLLAFWNGLTHTAHLVKPPLTSSDHVGIFIVCYELRAFLDWPRKKHSLSIEDPLLLDLCINNSGQFIDLGACPE